MCSNCSKCCMELYTTGQSNHLLGRILFTHRQNIEINDGGLNFNYNITTKQAIYV